jgi:hypothetical protein
VLGLFAPAVEYKGPRRCNSMQVFFFWGGGGGRCCNGRFILVFYYYLFGIPSIKFSAGV